MKKIISSIIVICLLFSLVSTMGHAEGDTSLSAGYINTINAKTNESAAYQGVCKNDTIYMSPEDIAAIGAYDCEVLSLERGTAEGIIENSKVLSKLYSKLNLDKLFKKGKIEYLVFSREDTTTDYITQIYYYDGYAQTMSKSFEVDTVKYDGQTYLNLEKMLYLMHAQWCVEESFLYYYPLDYNIFDFIGEKFNYMYENSVQHNSLLYDGENKWGHSTRIVLSHILNDVDMRIFIPFFGSDMIQEDWYEEAILQLATTDDSFIDDYGSKQISNYLKDSPYQKIGTGLNVIDGTLEEIKDLPDKMADTKLAKFSKWNDLATINTEQLEVVQNKISTFDNVVSAANILVDFNEINTRSKEWGDDFVNGLNILYTINEDIYGDCGKYILKTADNLLDEYENPTEEATEAAILDTCELILDNLIEKPIVGRIESIIALSNIIIKSNPNCAKAIENADLMNTVHALINVENVFLNEFVDSYHDYLHYLGVEDGSSSLRLFELMYTSINENPQKEVETHAISDMRNALEMFLKTSLRNKTYVYHFSYFNKGGSLWTPTSEAKELENDIYKTYALLSELISTRDYDKLLYLDNTFKSMYSDEYGCKREVIKTDILSDKIINNSNNVDYTEVINQYKDAIKKDYYADILNGISDDWDSVGEYVSSLLLSHARYYDVFNVFYALCDLNLDGVDELIIGAGEDGKNITKYDIFTYNNTPVPLFSVGGFGERTNFELYTTGIIYVSGSGGASYHGYEYYKLPSNSSQIEFIEGYSCEDYKYYKIDSEYKHIASISEELFEQKQQSYKTEEVLLEWNKISVDISNNNSQTLSSGNENDTNNQNTEQIRKSIIGSWAKAGSMVSEYDFEENGICYWESQKQEPGTYSISDDRELVIDFPWMHNEYTWSDLSFDEFHEEHDHDEYFWYFTDDGILMLNGKKYYKNGKVIIENNTEGDLLSILEGTWVSDNKVYKYKFSVDGTYEEIKVYAAGSTTKGKIDIVDETTAKLWQDIPEGLGYIPSYSELIYDAETDKIYIGGTHNGYSRAN